MKKCLFFVIVILIIFMGISCSNNPKNISSPFENGEYLVYSMTSEGGVVFGPVDMRYEFKKSDKNGFIVSVDMGGRVETNTVDKFLVDSQGRPVMVAVFPIWISPSLLKKGHKFSDGKTVTGFDNIDGREVAVLKHDYMGKNGTVSYYSKEDGVFIKGEIYTNDSNTYVSLIERGINQ